jgi:hypothetical protein
MHRVRESVGKRSRVWWTGRAREGTETENYKISVLKGQGESRHISGNMEDEGTRLETGDAILGRDNVASALTGVGDVQHAL